MGWERFHRVGWLQSPRLMLHGGLAPPKKTWLLQYGEWLSTGILEADPSVLSPEPPTPDFPQVTLVDSALPLLEPKMSVCKWNFVLWPFKTVPVPLAISPRWTETAAFHSWILCGCLFLALILWAGEPGLGIRHKTSQGNFLKLRYSSGTSATACGSGSTVFLSVLSTSLNVASSVNPWLQDFFQLVLNGFFKMIVL